MEILLYYEQATFEEEGKHWILWIAHISVLKVQFTLDRNSTVTEIKLLTKKALFGT